MYRLWDPLPGTTWPGGELGVCLIIELLWTIINLSRITWNASGRILYSNTYGSNPKTTTFSSQNP